MRSSRWLVLTTSLAITVAAVLLPTDASAQRRAVRRPAHPGVHGGARYYRPVYRSIYYRPFYSFGGYAGWYSGWYNWYGGYGGYGSPYGWSPYGYYGQPYPYARPYYDYSGSARLQVEPRHAQVFIDGYFVGTVDDFDGWTQRLHVPAGEHELEIFLQGYRSYRQKVLFRPGATVRIEHALQPLPAGEQADPRPTPSQSTTQPPARRGDPMDEPPEPPARRGDPMPPPRRDAPPPARAGESADYGAIAIRVQPTDAEVLVNGERWESPEAGDLTLQLADGTYRVEIRKDGFRTYSANIRVRRGETTSLNVSLSRQ